MRKQLAGTEPQNFRGSLIYEVFSFAQQLKKYLKELFKSKFVPSSHAFERVKRGGKVKMKRRYLFE